MPEPQFTPGPWVAEYRASELVVIFAGAESDVRPAPCLLADGNRETREANARLIAAAPDLYEAGVAVLETWDSGDLFVESLSGQEDALARGMERLKAALAKARAGI